VSLDLGFSFSEKSAGATGRREEVLAGAKVVIPGVRRPFGGRTGRAGGPVHYAL
jgi:hypothetical protein